jgi:putative DNA primase/helicase
MNDTTRSPARTKKNPVLPKDTRKVIPIKQKSEDRPIKLPKEITEGDFFTCWRQIGKDKVPFDPRDNQPAKINDPDTWTDFETCYKAYQEGRYDGVQRALTTGDPYFCIDIDGCFASDDGYMVTKLASEIVESFDTYAERSPSGKGLHVWGLGGKPGPRCRADGLEVYDHNHFITLTDNQYHGEEIKDCQPQLDKLYEERLAKYEEESHFDVENFVAFKTLTDEEIIEKVKKKLPELWGSDHSAYPSPSEGDLALAVEISRWTGPYPDKIDQIFRQSGRNREKWEKREDYRRKTIEKAIKGTKWFYGENLLNRVILPLEDFSALKIEPKKMILTPWLAENSVTMIAGPPGVGKSMLVQSLLISITHGQDFGPFKAENSVPCLYLDGEMDQQTAQERLSLLSPGGKPKQPLYIYSDAYSSSLNGIPPANLFDEKWRDQMTQMLVEKGVKVFAADNLVSLSPGIDEDRKVDYDPLNQWLKQLRYKRIAVILIHHTGKSGDQRGTSAREDNADTVILLRRPQGYCSHHGVRFKMHMRKARNMRPKELRSIRDRIFQLEEVSEDKSAWKFESTREDLIKEIVKLVAAGMKNVDIAKDLGVDPSYVGTIKSRSISRWKWLNADGTLTGTGEIYCYGSTETEDEEEDY